MINFDKHTSTNYRIRAEIHLKAINVTLPLEITKNYVSVTDAKVRAKVLAHQLKTKTLVLDSNGEQVEEFDFSPEDRTGTKNSTETREK